MGAGITTEGTGVISIPGVPWAAAETAVDKHNNAIEETDNLFEVFSFSNCFMAGRSLVPSWEDPAWKDRAEKNIPGPTCGRLKR